ncbi:MAG: glycosyltransferase family 2 protein [Bacteroidia bacterium]|nr:glycosyltransferase family 2 protein [Bacteroidia bacterium]MDW8159493.1 glycosyltransferase family 2 protein [Bacteroidia bacterium]
MKKSSKRSISVVIPSYNGKKLLEQNLPFLLVALEKNNIPYEVIVVDDASIDNTSEFLSQNYPQIKILYNKHNLGFAPTANKGIFAASLDLVFLLNNDVQITPYYFMPLFDYFEREDTFGVMGKIIGFENELIQDAAKFPVYRGIEISGTLNFEVSAENGELIPSFMLSGANALIDRQKLWELKGFNEIFAPFYWEDLDLSLRAWRLGWKCYYCPEAICRHKTSSTVKKYFPTTQAYNIAQRNKMILHLLHLSQPWLTLYCFKIFFKFLAEITLLRWNRKEKWKSFFYKLPSVFMQRKIFQTLAKQKGGPLSLKQVKQNILKELQGKKYQTF